MSSSSSSSSKLAAIWCRTGPIGSTVCGQHTNEVSYKVSFLHLFHQFYFPLGSVLAILCEQNCAFYSSSSEPSPPISPNPLLLFLLLLLLLVPFDIAVRAVTKRPGAGMRRWCSRVACAEPPPLSVDLGDLRLLRW